MKTLIAALSLLASACAHCQAIDFKGSKFGDSSATFQEQQRGFVCWEGHNPCRLFVRRASPGRDDMAMTYGGEPVSGFAAAFSDDKLGQVSMTIKPESFDRIVAALTGKYGKPTKASKEKIQNRLGASFDQATATWARADGTIHAARYGSKTDAGVVILTSKEFGKDLAKRDDAARAKAAADL